jgi:hypothetical protein
MSLSDMLNFARNAQAYQQAQQMNPLQLQQAQLQNQQAQQNLQQSQQMNPIAYQKAQQELQQSQIGTKQKQLDLDQSHFNLSGNVLSGLEARAQTLAQKKDYSTAIKELDIAEKWLNTSGVPSKDDGAFDVARKQLQNGDFNGYMGTLENMRNILAGAASRYQANLPQVSTVGGAPATFTPATGTATPLNIGGQAQQAAGTNVAAPPQQPQGVTQTQMSLQYPVRKAGDIRPYGPSEQADQDAGYQYRNSLATAASSQSTSLRNLDEVIKQAQQVGENEWGHGTGIAGTIGRNVSTFLGTEQGVAYKQLSKDLANVQMANMQAMGMSTDKDKVLQAAANGDYTYPPSVLIDIARRAKADRENISMQAQGAQAFSKKYGDNNMKTFQDQWANNSKDSRVFEAINIYNSNLSKKEKIDKIDKLFEGESASTIKRLTQQKNNLINLSKTGEL